MAGLRALFRRKQVAERPQAVIQQPVMQQQNLGRLNTASTGDSTNSRSFFRRIFSKNSALTPATTGNTASSSTGSSEENTSRVPTRREESDTAQAPTSQDTRQPQSSSDHPFALHPQHEHEQEQEVIAPQDPEPYNFPIVALTDDRYQFINTLLPEINSHPVFDMNAIVDSLVESLDYDESDDDAWYELLSCWTDENVDNLHDFKRTVLEAGFSLGVLTTKMEDCLGKYLQQSPVMTKMGCIRTLENMKSEHYLCLFEVDHVWSSLLETGFMKDMYHKEALHNFLRTVGDYRGFPNFVDLVLLTHNWDQHFILPREPEQLEEMPSIKLHPELAQNAILTEIVDGSYECLICVEELDVNDDFWNCCGCHRVFHIECISRWSKEGSTRRDNGDWFCPSCRHCHRTQQFEANCWCRKNRKTHNTEAPGSCGQVCGKKIPGFKSGRACKMTCHPGSHHQTPLFKGKPLYQLNQERSKAAEKELRQMNKNK